MKILRIRRDKRPFECTKGTCLFTSHCCLFFATMQYDNLFMTDPGHCTKWTHEVCTTHRGFDNYFYDDCKD